LIPVAYEATDREQILDVIMRYAVSVDRRDFDGVAACFTDDASALYSGVQLEPGVDNIINHIRGIENMPCSQHMFGSSTVEIDGDTAHSVSYALAYLVRPSGDGHDLTTRGLEYDDDWVRTDEGWKIKTRRHRPLWSTNGPVEYPVAPVTR
jgi:ketosteroid isomerase-like protein